MPTSDLRHLSDIISILKIMRPQTVIEVGIGFGKYGFLMREYLDLHPDEQLGFSPWKMTIDGIEVHEKYLTPVHRYIYDNIYIGDAQKRIDDINKHYNCLLAVDVLEHFRKEDAMKFLEQAKRCADEVVICTPYGYFDQGEEFNNPYEAHYSAWIFNDFHSAGARYIWKTGIGLIAVFTDRDYHFPSVTEETFNSTDLNNLKLAMRMYANTAQYDAGIQLAQIYLMCVPDDLETFVILSLCNEKNKNYGEAKKYIDKALAIAPDLEIAKLIRDRIENII